MMHHRDIAWSNFHRLHPFFLRHAGFDRDVLIGHHTASRYGNSFGKFVNHIGLADHPFRVPPLDGLRTGWITFLHRTGEPANQRRPISVYAGMNGRHPNWLRRLPAKQSRRSGVEGSIPSPSASSTHLGG